MIEKRINSLDSSGLGLKRDGSVSLRAHNPRWPREFSQDAHRIFETLQIPDLRLCHIGSTAIPGRSTPVSLYFYKKPFYSKLHESFLDQLIKNARRILPQS